MKSWFRGKPGGLLAFVLIVSLVTGGLGWVTGAALQLEQEQLQTRAETDLFAKLRQALWQLDSIMMAKLSSETNRPLSHFDVLYPQANPVDLALNRQETGTVLEVSPLVGGELPEWILLHFSVGEARKPASPAGGWWSPQVPSAELQKKLKGITDIPPARWQEKAVFLTELQGLLPDKFLSTVRREEQRLVAIRVQVVEEEANKSQKNLANNDLSQQGQGFSEYQSRAGRLMTLSQDNAKTQRPQNFLNSTPLGGFSPNGEHWLKPGLREKSREILVTPGPWTPLWVKTKNDQDRLILARLVTAEKQQVCQGILLNWEALQKQLAAEVTGIFPEARLDPVRLENSRNAQAPFPPHPERTMATLPVELDPGPMPVLDDPGWTPLRIGLALAWAAAIVALTAVGLGGWSLIDLSQRRIRFVSTVTHELRTPLTTLRLYLDMLTGGMVQDDKQKDEYLHTLNAETDRLNRLVGNVLDFSRLENQKPRLHLAPIRIADLLEQVRASWSMRCQDAGKELVVDNRLADHAAQVTDLNLTQQLLGNLIDNACKYSRSADDPRIWLRARTENGLLLLEVEDRGPGVAKKERRSIFRPFRRGQGADVTAGGVGLGLALSARWAGFLGGKLSVYPGQDNTGACFRLELPRREG